MRSMKALVLGLLVVGCSDTTAPEARVTGPVPFQGHFANTDDWCAPEAVDALSAALAVSASPHEVHRYDAAHAFFNESVEAYDAESARLAWRRSLEFLRGQA